MTKSKIHRYLGGNPTGFYHWRQVSSGVCFMCEHPDVGMPPIVRRYRGVRVVRQTDSFGRMLVSRSIRHTNPLCLQHSLKREVNRQRSQT